MDKLKPCPFCGGDADIKNISKSAKPHWCVICCSCGSRGREVSHGSSARVKDKKRLAYFEEEARQWAIGAWNRRSSDDDETD